MIAPPWLLAIGLVMALLLAIPARRLRTAGVAPRTIGLYVVGLWLLTMLIAIRPGATRLLVPIVVVAYVAPFVAAPDVVGRVLGRRPPGRAPMKNVTPPDPPDPTDPPDPHGPPDPPGGDGSR